MPCILEWRTHSRHSDCVKMFFLCSLRGARVAIWCWRALPGHWQRSDCNRCRVQTPNIVHFCPHCRSEMARTSQNEGAKGWDIVPGQDMKKGRRKTPAPDVSDEDAVTSRSASDSLTIRAASGDPASGSPCGRSHCSPNLAGPSASRSPGNPRPTTRHRSTTNSSHRRSEG